MNEAEDLGRVSVIIPNLNQGRFLRKCLDSVLLQTKPPYEVLVGDGGSTDDSLAILADYEAVHPRTIKVYRLDLGVNPTIELLVKESKGDFIAFLGADDWWDPNFLKEMLEAIGDACLVYCDVYSVWPDRIKVWEVPDHDLALLRRTNYISFNATVIRKTVLEEVIRSSGQLLDDKVGVPSDWDLWLRMDPNCRFVHVSRPLSYYRKHKKQNSARLRLQYDIFQIYRRYNRVTASSIVKIFFIASIVSFLRMNRLGSVADFLLIPFYSKPVNRRDY